MKWKFSNGVRETWKHRNHHPDATNNFTNGQLCKQERGKITSDSKSEPSPNLCLPHLLERAALSGCLNRFNWNYLNSLEKKKKNHPARAADPSGIVSLWDEKNRNSMNAIKGLGTLWYREGIWAHCKNPRWVGSSKSFQVWDQPWKSHPAVTAFPFLSHLQ